MTYKLSFRKEALKEWRKLDTTIQDQFKKKLKKILENPLIPSSKLSGFGCHNCYKIKLRQSGYRLVYEVLNEDLNIIVISVGKRQNLHVYQNSMDRLREK